MSFKREGVHCANNLATAISFQANMHGMWCKAKATGEPFVSFVRTSSLLLMTEILSRRLCITSAPQLQTFAPNSA